MSALLYASLTLNPRPLVAQKVTRTDELKISVQKSRPPALFYVSTGLPVREYLFRGMYIAENWLKEPRTMQNESGS